MEMMLPKKYKHKNTSWMKQASAIHPGWAYEEFGICFLLSEWQSLPQLYAIGYSPRIKKGELSHGEESTAPSQPLQPVLKPKFVPAREGITWGGERALCSVHTAASPDGSRGAGLPPALQDQPIVTSPLEISLSLCDDDCNCLCKPPWALQRLNYLSLWTTKHSHLESTTDERITIYAFLQRRAKKEKENC